MRLKYSFELMDMGNEIIAVPVGENAGQLRGVVRLNKSGAVILELLKTDTTEDEMVNILAEKYENGRSDLSLYVHTVVEKLRKDGIIEES